MEKSRRGIQSIEIGSGLLLQLAKHVRPVALKDLAKAAGMTAGKAHPYMVSFLKVGFVTQTDAGHYELGPLALAAGVDETAADGPGEGGLATHRGSRSRNGPERGNCGVGKPRPDDRQTRGADPALARQPAHRDRDVAREHRDRETVRCIHATESGRASARRRACALRARHRLKRRRSPRTALESLLAETRKHGLSRTRGQPIPGIDALCAPVFDSEGHIVLGILVMGPSATFDSNWDGAVAKPLKRCASEVSRRIGRAEQVGT